MIDLPKQSICHYCQRELRTGEGRYRLLFKKSEVECCPACFDTIHATHRLKPEKERSAGQLEKEF
jgi:hypothetical protein